jgi:hypothetical protein
MKEYDGLVPDLFHLYVLFLEDSNVFRKIRKTDGTGDKMHKLLRNFVFVTIQHNEAGLCKKLTNCSIFKRLQSPFRCPRWLLDA